MKRQTTYFIAAICTLIAMFPGEQPSQLAYSQTQRPKINIEGTWTLIYRDWNSHRDWRSFPVCMLPAYEFKGTGSTVGPYVVKITRDHVIDLAGQPVRVSAYELKSENGVTHFDEIPLDKENKKIEKDRQCGILVLKDDFLFLALGAKKRITSLTASRDESEEICIFRRGVMWQIPDVDSAGEFRDEKR